MYLEKRCRPKSATADADSTTKIAKTTPTSPMPEYYEDLKDAPSTNSRPIRRRRRTANGNSSRSRWNQLLSDRDGCHILALADEIERMVREREEA